LSTRQVELARRFSRPHVDRFASVSFRLGWSDAPLVDDCVAWFECRHHARHRAGDHVVFIGEIVTVERARGRGLVFQHGQFGATTPLPD
ncbi:MAG TPA: flavin reductase family protein, partial [Casimicrobiaceae bacterium]|nr:flavin reductase family protein [Casimicrobiaceae bacterium]